MDLSPHRPSPFSPTLRCARVPCSRTRPTWRYDAAREASMTHVAHSPARGGPALLGTGSPEERRQPIAASRRRPSPICRRSEVESPPRRHIPGRSHAVAGKAPTAASAVTSALLAPGGAHRGAPGSENAVAGMRTPTHATAAREARPRGAAYRRRRTRTLQTPVQLVGHSGASLRWAVLLRPEEGVV